TPSFVSCSAPLCDLLSFPTRRSSDLVQVLQPLDPAQRVERGLEHVVRIVGAERLREDVLHARCLEDRPHRAAGDDARAGDRWLRSEEHTSELQSPYDLVCRLLLEKKK